MALVKTVTRVLVIGGLATGTAVLVAGPHRVSALFNQAHHSIVTKIDNVIEDPVALRQQLRELESAYPARIADVRTELTEVRDQVAELERERGISEKVVKLASADLSSLQPSLKEANAARSSNPAAVITIRYEGQRLPLDEAYAKATQISNTIRAYNQRAEQASQNLTFLAQQEDRLAELLMTLETERAELQSRLWLLNGEIEMIARNEKLIDMSERRERAIQRYERYDAVSLEQVTRRISKIRSEQEARFEALAVRDGQTDYEDRARTMLETEASAREVFERSLMTMPDVPETIEINATSGDDNDDTAEDEIEIASR